MWTLILHFFGVEPRTPSTAYNFWSGFGSDISEMALIAAGWHLLNCHEEGCKRVGRHTEVVDGHHIRRCRRCHRKALNV